MAGSPYQLARQMPRPERHSADPAQRLPEPRHSVLLLTSRRSRNARARHLTFSKLLLFVRVHLPIRRRRFGISIPSPCNAFECQKCCKCPRAPLHAFWKYWVSSKWIKMRLGTFKCRQGDRNVGRRSKCDHIHRHNSCQIFRLT